MGECFEILNILVEVLVLGKGQGSRQYLKQTLHNLFRWWVWHIKKQGLLYV